MIRRTFHEKAILLLGGLISAGLALPALAYLLIPGRKEEGGGWTDAAPLDALPDGKPTELKIQRERVDAWRKATVQTTAWVVRKGDEITAFGPNCPHLGCGYRWQDDEEQFICPCHDSFFAVDGSVISGPSPRPLDRYRTRVDGGRLWLGEVVRSDELEG